MPLPTGDFERTEDEGVEKCDLSECSDGSERGCFLKIDARENEVVSTEWMSVNEEMLFETQKSILDQLKCIGEQEEEEDVKAKKTGKAGAGEEIGVVERENHCPTNKLLLNLYDKKEYVMHYRNLKLYTSLGIEITKIHKVSTFKQSKWLKQYIDFNSSKRALAQNDLKKISSLMNNAMFGKTMENFRIRRLVNLVTGKCKRRNPSQRFGH